ncbi:MAG: hypothetical protein D6820_08065, partial [Lentisphaerae bacterium]
DQAKHLAYYIQQRGKLKQLLVECSKNAATDPTGVRTLLNVMGEESLQALDQSWRNFIRLLPAPRR